MNLVSSRQLESSLLLDLGLSSLVSFSELLLLKLSQRASQPISEACFSKNPLILLFLLFPLLLHLSLLLLHSLLRTFSAFPFLVFKYSSLGVLNLLVFELHELLLDLCLHFGQEFLFEFFFGVLSFLPVLKVEVVLRMHGGLGSRSGVDGC